MDENTQTHRGGQEPPRDESVPHETSYAEQDKLQQTLALGDQALGYLTNLADLFRLEAMLALKSAPRAFIVWLLLMPAILLTWLAFSIMVSWGVYEWLAIPITGFATFFLLNLILLVICKFSLQRYVHRMGFPETRAQIQAAMGGLQDEIDKARQSEK